MVIIDEKQMLPPPPPYSSSTGLVPISPPPFPGQRKRDPTTLATLPSHILLYIVHQTLPQQDGAYGGQGKVERQRKVLYWMTISLRLVNRSLYIACMHVLRSTYLPAYTSLIRPPYSSDPFPLTTPTPTYPYSSASASHLTSPVNSMQRETAVLDQFIAIKVHEDVWVDDTELHLEREEVFKDLFDLTQPRARLEDLVRAGALDAGVISVSSSPNAVVGLSSSEACSSSSTTRTGTGSPIVPTFSFSQAQQQQPFPVVGPPPPSAIRKSKSASRKKLPFAALSCSFSPRSAGIVYTTRSGRRTIVDVPRTRDEKLEIAAKRLVRELIVWVEENLG